MIKRTILLGTAVFVLAAGSALADTPVKGPFAGTVHSVGSITYWTARTGPGTGIAAGSRPSTTARSR